MNGAARPTPRPVCALCGATAAPRFRPPQPEGAPDLDMRPGEPARATLHQWLQTCRRCGATAPDLAAPDLVAPDLAAPDLAAPALTTPPVTARAHAGNGEPAWSDPTRSPFLRYAALCQALGDRSGEAEAWLWAAWAADDAGDDATAAAHRHRVAALWAGPTQAGTNQAGTTQAGTTQAGTALRRLDVLRRAAAWQQAEAWATEIAHQPWDDSARAIIAFQRARIAARDAGRYLISSALPPPAHAPHVTHVRQRRPGIMARLFGRA